MGKIIAETSSTNNLNIGPMLQDDLLMLHALFRVVKVYVLAAGGDGDGWVISGNFKKIADLFEEYERQKEHDPWFIERSGSEADGCIAFHVGQEYISFVSPDYELPEWGGDIIVKVHWKGF